jgi:hypothetical protein
VHRPLSLIIASLLFAATAGAAEIPARKPGLWDMTLTLEGRIVAPVLMQQCVDAATDRPLQSKLTNVKQEVCTKRDVQNSGDTITVDSVCKFGMFTVTTHTVVTGSFDSAYTARINSKREGGSPLPAGAQSVIGDRTLVVAGKWLGPCKADQKPGDIITPDGIKTNVRDMLSRPGPTPSR